MTEYNKGLLDGQENMRRALCDMQEVKDNYLKEVEKITETLLSIEDRLIQAENLLLLALYHHPGATSEVGQPIRRYFKIGRFDQMSEMQINRAKGCINGN
jgi:hypothetical protein